MNVYLVLGTGIKVVDATIDKYAHSMRGGFAVVSSPELAIESMLEKWRVSFPEYEWAKERSEAIHLAPALLQQLADAAKTPTQEEARKKPTLH